MDKNEQRICWYSSLLIALLINTPKLMALRQNGIIARYWHFNLNELLFQILFNLFFCILLFYINLHAASPIAIYRKQRKFGIFIFLNILLFLIFMVTGGSLQYIFFAIRQLPRPYLFGNMIRLGLSAVIAGILMKITLLIREGKKKSRENDQLKNAYMAAELELLKEQMNPHFLFNSLSSLSGLIRENPVLAQKYVLELSSVFRYSLHSSKANLVTLEEELKMLGSFTQLISMRLEKAFEMDIRIDHSILSCRLPHLSLQPLVENAVKHNAATIQRPLKVAIFTAGHYLVISNTTWEIPVPESSNGMGLVNLNERFRMLMQEEIIIQKTAEYFTVKLPLKT